MDHTTITLHVEDTGGAGRPVILIHGWPLSGASWAKQVPVLREAGYRVITYDRRGFGRSEKPTRGFEYDTLAADLSQILVEKDLRDATIVGFSMGGGEVARYLSRYGEERIHSAVFAGAVPPYMMKTADNPEGFLTPEDAEGMEAGLRKDRAAFFDGFTRAFFGVDGVLKVTEAERQAAVAQCLQSDETAALACMEAFGTTDFRDDLPKITVPVLVLHGDSDDIVLLEGSGARTHAAIPHSELRVIKGAPHGFSVSHADEFNAALLDFLAR